MKTSRLVVAAVSLFALFAFAITTKRVVLENEHVFNGAITFNDTVALPTSPAPTIGGKNIITSHTLNDGGVAPLALETYVVTLSGGTATVTFATAFSYPPVCVCSDVATSAAACSASGATTTQVVPKGGSTATINLVCVGAR